jgi:hypothetical protein|tara:strand:- start:220 stop:609 length:390 start_codon:yes stop_codon:yes gene_type:complete
MAKYISFTVTDGAGSGLGLASAFQDGTNLVPVDLISGVFQASAVSATIQLDSVGAADVITVIAGTAATGAAGAPTTVSAPLLKQAIQYAMSANPGGVVAKVSLGLDSGQTAAPAAATGLRMYWRSFIQA